MKELKKLVENKNGQPVTSSRLVAQKFGKQHKDVLRSIQNMDIDQEFNERNFAPVKYKDAKGESRPEYIISKDGFVFLAMGFTGKEAAKFKIDYINAFNRMEEQIKSLKPPSRKQLAQWVVEAEETIELQKQQLQIQAPKVNYHDKVLKSESTYVTNQIAKELGMSAISLNRILANLKIQYKQNETWLLYQKYQNKGFTKTKTYTYTGTNGEARTSMQTVWTEKGRRFIHEHINSNTLLSA